MAIPAKLKIKSVNFPREIHEKNRTSFGFEGWPILLFYTTNIHHPNCITYDLGIYTLCYVICRDKWFHAKYNADFIFLHLTPWE